MSTTSTISTTLATEINTLHAKAVHHAGSAIDFAKQAGELLLKAKSDLPHGDFLPWLEANCTVTPRQAQRYMAAAQGKPIPVRAIKCDTVSYLPDATKTDTVSDLPDIPTPESPKTISDATEIDSSSLRKLEEAFQKNLDLENRAKADTSKCLKYILSKKLYLERCETFEEYCLVRFGWSPAEVEEIHTDAFLYSINGGRAA